MNNEKKIQLMQILVDTYNLGVKKERCDVTGSLKKILEVINFTHCCESDSELLNVSFNVGDKVLFDNKKAVVLWTSVKYVDIEIVGTNKILQGVHTSKVLPR